MNKKDGNSLSIVMIVWFNLLAILQFFAVYQLFSVHYQWSWILSGFASLCLFYIPVIGSIAAYCGATFVWEWVWWKAGLLFFSCAIVYIIFMLFAICKDLLQRKN